MNTLVVPKGTQLPQRLTQVQINPIDNGFILNRMYLIQEANRPPFQNGTTEFFPTWKAVLEELAKEEQ